MLTIKTQKDLRKLNDKYKLDSDSQETARAYKFVTREGFSPMNIPIKIQYIVGQQYQVSIVNTDERVECGAGINLATLRWCQRMKGSDRRNRVLTMEFRVSDIAAIPILNDGKFRVRCCKVIGEYGKIWRWLNMNIW